MTTDDHFDAAISTWFEEAGPARLPARLPERVLSATFERTRRTRQQVGWRELLDRRDMTRFVPALGGAAVVVVAAALALTFYFNQPSVGGPDVDPRRPFEGTWVNRTDADGGTQTMTVRAAEAGGVEIVVVDDIATLSGPPLAEQLRNLTFVYHPETDTLSLGSDLEAVWQRQNEPELSPGPSASPPSEAEVTALLNAFLQARIAGEGAQQYLHSLYPDILWEDIPLLYATSSGAPYERAEFEPVPGIEWPYGFIAFKVRLFAGDTVVEQLFFMPHDDPEYFPADGRLGLEYQPNGFGTDIPPTTEDGQPVAVPYNSFDGEVTLHAAHPWIMSDYREFGGVTFGRLIPEGPGGLPTTDGGQRTDWDELFLMADPALLGADCQTGPSPADAAALAESIRSHPDLGATAPVVVSVGGADALMMDVKIAAGATVCAPTTSGGDLLANALLRPVLDDSSVGSTVFVNNGVATGHATGEWMRLYLFDAPEGLSMRILAIAIVAPESRFERAVTEAAPVVDSVEFHAP